MRSVFSRTLTFVLTITLFVTSVKAASAATYYVSPTGNDSNSGTSEAQAWRTMQRAGQVNAGDTVNIAPGTYTGTSGAESVLRPANSGTASQRITFKSLNATRPVLVGRNTVKDVINLTGRNYITIENLELQDPCSSWCRWLTLENANNNIVNNTHFTLTRPSTGVDWIGIDFRNATFNRLSNCRIGGWGIYGDPYNNGGDAIQLNGTTHHNVIEGCDIGDAGHAGLQLDGGDTYFNVIRNNTFHNALEKAYETTQRRPGRFEYNLFEGNTCTESRYNSELHGGMCLHINANYNIIRRNQLRGALGWAIDVQTWGEETRNNIGNHIFHNTIVNNGIDQSRYDDQSTTGIEFANYGYTGSPHRDHVVKNNILYDNKPQTQYNPPRTTQLLIQYENLPNGPFGGIRVAGNLMYWDSPTGNVISVLGVGEGSAAWFNQNHPSNFWGNIQQAPQFEAYNQGTATNPLDGTFDLRLRAGSPGIDQGVALTNTTAAGTNSTTITVQDAGYFHDGFDGIITADQIRVGSETVTITDIDYGANRITVDRAISWSANAPVNLPFSGSGPDIGALESTHNGNPQTSPSPAASPSVVPSVAPSPSANPNCRLADIDQNGSVGTSDRTILVGVFFQVSPANPRADINADGRVDLSDYALLARSFGLSCN